MFNNAGIANAEVRSVDLTEEEWDRVIDVNLKGVFLGIKYAVPELKNLAAERSLILLVY
jgi:NAD(P)-dependent dehydrogenase (short-subunit alcohol dehydrogenase family)